MVRTTHSNSGMTGMPKMCDRFSSRAAVPGHTAREPISGPAILPRACATLRNIYAEFTQSLRTRCPVVQLGKLRTESQARRVGFESSSSLLSYTAGRATGSAASHGPGHGVIQDLPKLRNIYAELTHCLRNVYAELTQNFKSRLRSRHGVQVTQPGSH